MSGAMPPASDSMPSSGVSAGGQPIARANGISTSKPVITATMPWLRASR